MSKELFPSLTSGRFVAKINTPINPERERELVRQFGPRPVDSFQRKLVHVISRLKESLGIRA